MMLRIGSILLLFIFSACGKEHSGVPDVYVNYHFSDAEFLNSSINGVVMLVPNEGVAGLMIYKGPNGYVAYDRCSTVNPEQRCAVTPDDSGFTVTDPCSGGKFLLLDGSPQKAPAKRALKTYRVVSSSALTYSVIN